MFISHYYKFIFIKTRKTAGSSIEKFFYDSLKETDIIFGGMPPENFAPVNCDAENPEHIGHKIIKSLYPFEWDNYYKITIERNPWDKMVSLYHWQKSVKPYYNIGNFEDYIKYRRKLWYKNDWELYTEKDTPCVDRIMQYESLNEDMALLCNHLGINYNNDLISLKLKGNYRTNKNYRNYYSTETKSIVQQSYSNTIDFFNYKF